MTYYARPIPFNAGDFGKHESLIRVAAFEKNAGAYSRQAAINYVVKAHAFSTSQTISLLYDPALDQPGKNVAARIAIGPSAFNQDEPWLSGVVFHELVHTPQYFYYTGKGITQIDPKRSETERRMFALDEYEAYWWTYHRRAELGLSVGQQAEIRRRAGFALIDVDEPAAKALAERQRFDDARDELIRQFNAKTTSTRAATTRKPTCCYA